MRLLVTGGAGFIGSNFVRMALGEKKPELLVNLDKLTYAGNLENLAGLGHSPSYKFVKGDVCDAALVERLFYEHSFDAVINFAAESHVDRSIQGAEPFVRSNVLGVQVLLDAALRHGVNRFIQIGTDEVYGSAPEGVSFTETDALSPSSPYSASKAGGDLLALSYFVTHKLPVMITRSTNNYGPYQHPEKFMPLFITNSLRDLPCPLYGSGRNVRDWLYVLDNCEGIWAVLEKGKLGEVYNIGAGNEKPNSEVAGEIMRILGKPSSLVRQVADRKGHDLRYSVDASKARALGWSPKASFEEGMAKTIEWYKQNRRWWEKLAAAPKA